MVLRLGGIGAADRCYFMLIEQFEKILRLAFKLQQYVCINGNHSKLDITESCSEYRLSAFNPFKIPDAAPGSLFMMLN